MMVSECLEVFFLFVHAYSDSSCSNDKGIGALFSSVSLHKHLWIWS